MLDHPPLIVLHCVHVHYNSMKVSPPPPPPQERERERERESVFILPILSLPLPLSLLGSLSSPGDGIVRITLLTQVKKEREDKLPSGH